MNNKTTLTSRVWTYLQNELDAWCGRRLERIEENAQDILNWMQMDIREPEKEYLLQEISKSLHINPVRAIFALDMLVNEWEVVEVEWKEEGKKVCYYKLKAIKVPLSAWFINGGESEPRCRYCWAFINEHTATELESCLDELRQDEKSLYLREAEWGSGLCEWCYKKIEDHDRSERKRCHDALSGYERPT